MSKNHFSKKSKEERHLESIEGLQAILKRIIFIESICDTFTNIELTLEDEEMGRASIVLHLKQMYKQLQKLQDNAFNIHEVFTHDDIIGFGEIHNNITHDYENIDLPVIENIIRNKLPNIKRAIENHLLQHDLNNEEDNALNM